MTLIVGVKCSDGIVLGSDGAATMGAHGQSTIRQPVKKLTIVREGVVLGVSGPIGLSQQYAGIVGELWDAKDLQKQKSHVAMKTLQRELWSRGCLQQVEIANVARQTFGQVAVQSALASTVLALPVDKELRLYQFDQQCAPEEATVDLPFVSIGSGQPIADPFLALIRRVFWPSSLPTLADGLFAVFWTLSHAIQVTPGGVADPKQIVVVKEQKTGVYQARELDDTEFEDHLEAVAAAEDSLRNFKKAIGTPDKIDAAEPPIPG